MAITAISRDWGIDPQIVRIVSTDTLATITAAGYLAAQATNIKLLNNGAFEWKSDDSVLVSYPTGNILLTYDATNAILVLGDLGSTQVRVTSAQILAMSATPVLMIPAPGTGKQIIVGRIVGTYLFGTTQYAAGGAIGLERGNTAALAGPAASNTLAAATFNAYAASNNFELTPDNTDTVANIANLGIYLSNATAAFTTGDGTLLMSIDYKTALAA